MGGRPRGGSTGLGRSEISVKGYSSGITSRSAMEALGFLQEPLEPAALEPQVLELCEGPTLVYPGVMGELSPLDKRKNDSVLQSGQD